MWLALPLPRKSTVNDVLKTKIPHAHIQVREIFFLLPISGQNYQTCILHMSTGLLCIVSWGIKRILRGGPWRLGSQVRNQLTLTRQFVIFESGLTDIGLEWFSKWWQGSSQVDTPVCTAWHPDDTNIHPFTHVKSAGDIHTKPWRHTGFTLLVYHWAFSFSLWFL